MQKIINENGMTEILTRCIPMCWHMLLCFVVLATVASTTDDDDDGGGGDGEADGSALDLPPAKNNNISMT